MIRDRGSGILKESSRNRADTSESFIVCKED